MNQSLYQFNQTIIVLVDLETTGLKVISQLNFSGFDASEISAPILFSPGLTKIGIKINRFNSSLIAQNISSKI